jgi:hypothetical protein
MRVRKEREHTEATRSSKEVVPTVTNTLIATVKPEVPSGSGREGLLSVYLRGQTTKYSSVTLGPTDMETDDSDVVSYQKKA